MPNHTEVNEVEAKLPHHHLLAWTAVLDLARAVKAAGITDAHLRDQAMRAAKNACCNCGEAASKMHLGDVRRSFSIARGEAGEAACAVETAVAMGYAPPGKDLEVNRAAALAIRLLGGLAR